MRPSAAERTETMTEAINITNLSTDTRVRIAEAIQDELMAKREELQDLEAQLAAVAVPPAKAPRSPAKGRQASKAPTHVSAPRKPATWQSGGKEPTTEDVAGIIRTAGGKLRLSAIVGAGGFDRGKTVAIIRQLVATGYVGIDGKSYTWTGPVNPEPADPEPESDYSDVADI